MAGLTAAVATALLTAHPLAAGLLTIWTLGFAMTVAAWATQPAFDAAVKAGDRSRASELAAFMWALVAGAALMTLLVLEATA